MAPRAGGQKVRPRAETPGPIQPPDVPAGGELKLERSSCDGYVRVKCRRILHEARIRQNSAYQQYSLTFDLPRTRVPDVPALEWGRPRPLTATPGLVELVARERRSLAGFYLFSEPPAPGICSMSTKEDSSRAMLENLPAL